MPRIVSLRARLALWSAALAAVVTLGAAAAFYEETRGTLLEDADAALAERAQSIAAVWRRDASAAALTPFTARRPWHGFEVREVPSLAVLARSPTLEGAAPLADDATLASLLGPRDGSPAARRRLFADSDAAGRRLRTFAGVFRTDTAAHGADGRPPRIVVVTAADAAEADEELSEVLRGMAATVPVALAVAAVGAWWIARRIARPLESIASAAAEVDAGHPGRRVPESGSGDEADSLARTLNRTIARLEDAYARQTRFASDASHELRTPVAVVLAQCDVALRRPRTDAEYRAALEEVRAAAKRMGELIEGLMVLARPEGSAGPPRRETIDLAETARAAVAALDGASRDAAIAVRVETSGDCAVAGDPRLVDVLVRNVVANAVAYSDRGGEVAVTVTGRADDVALAVRDRGIVIAPDELPHVFERFHRGDAARARNASGAGLGLALVRRIAELHGGTAEVTSDAERGTIVTATLARAGAGGSNRGGPNPA
jgi:heavy metal sensor kinase